MIAADRKKLLGCLAFVACCAVPSLAHADDRADALFKEGRQLLDAKKYDEACAKLSQSQEIEPGAMAKMQKWEFRSGQAGWGDFDAMMKTIDHAIDGRPWLLGDMFSIADVVFGGTLRYMVRFGMLQPSPAIGAYIERLAARPAAQRADARNHAMIQQHGLAT